ncbi:hypothetical protein [Saccharothrix variisporea]|uniref:Uncharacterized protein n=1 Tax=Saccharothrix variisporea TaxID=543527 RepID=A0A495X0K8_9PSEU|nr:hypothetical protein [Saccharothrix variisporea]RKT67086.1 hypothetical protein DFJ66_0254 [Saccharothrix variisporea]
MSDIFTMADLDGLLQLMRDARHEYPGPFLPAVIALVDDVHTYHRPDENGDCEAIGCQDQHGDTTYNQGWPCPLWMRAQTAAVAWLRERAAEANPSDRTENPHRVAARERKARQRQRERDASASAEASGNRPGNSVTTTSPEGLFSKEPQVGESRPAGQARDSLRDSPGDNPSETSVGLA